MDLDPVPCGSQSEDLSTWPQHLLHLCTCNSLISCNTVLPERIAIINILARYPFDEIGLRGKRENPLFKGVSSEPGSFKPRLSRIRVESLHKRSTWACKPIHFGTRNILQLVFKRRRLLFDKELELKMFCKKHMGSFTQACFTFDAKKQNSLDLMRCYDLWVAPTHSHYYTLAHIVMTI